MMNFEAGDYPKSLLRELRAIFQAKEFTDVQISVGHRTFAGHRNVLSAASPYFHAMFTSELLEKGRDHVVIRDVRPEIFDLLLGFIYSGKLRVDEENCQELMAAADMFRMSDVLEACCSFLEKQLHPSNCIGIHLFADSHGCVDLSKASETFIHDHFLEVTKEEEYLQLSKDNLIKLLQSENLHIESEYQVFHAAMFWITQEPPLRRKLVFDVLSPVRFPLVSRKKLEKYIEECGDLSLKIALRKLVQDYRFSRANVPLEQKLSRMKPFLFQPRKNSLRSIYVIGGYSRETGGRWSDSLSLVTVEAFNTFNQQWSPVPALHHPRSGHGVAVLGGSIYVIGGESDSLIFDNAERYDPTVNKWTMMPSMTVPRCGLGVAVVDSVIYAIGGWVGSEIGNSIERFDPVINCWSQWDKLPTLRFAMGVIAIDGLIYIIGGMSDLGTEMKVVESYNPVVKEWSKMADMRTHRAYVSLAYHDNYIYAVGGWNDDDGALNSVEKYSIDDGKWSAVSAMSMRRAGAAVISVNGLIYAIGGRLSNDDLRGSAPCTTDTVECYDPQTDSWMMINPMPTSRCEAAAVII